MITILEKAKGNLPVKAPKVKKAAPVAAAAAAAAAPVESVQVDELDEENKPPQAAPVKKEKSEPKVKSTVKGRAAKVPIQ